ncbi:urea ABC transporter permease subunit UrtB [Corallincola spongiicola]|nr:urea ABC transporter permease subunit UrtB [Corallincola spongiicola]
MKWLSFFLCWMALALTSSAHGTVVEEPLAADQFNQGLTLLGSKKYPQKEQAVRLLLASKDPRTQTILQMLLDGQLYRQKKTNAVVFMQKAEDGATHVAPLLVDGEINRSYAGLLAVKKRSVKRVGLNNALRKQIKQGLATLGLAAEDPANRAAAIEALIGELTPETNGLLVERLALETDDDVRELITIALAVDNLNKESTDLAADIAVLADSLQPTARNALVSFADATENPELKQQAEKALARIDQKVKYSGFAETLFFGLSLGSVLVLAAIGLAITFGVMGVINMAHGELIMLGAYTTYVVQLLMPNHIGLSILVAIPAAFIVSGVVGIAIERFVIRFLYGRPLETLLATFGLSLILQQAVRSVFSPLNRSVATPDWMSGSLMINPVLSLTLNRLYIVLFCLIVFALLFALLRYTRLGLQVRAVSQNRAMARAMGVRSSRVDALTFGLGSGVAGVAGVALSQLTNVGPNLGQAYIIDSFMVVVFGGVGNLWGTLVAGLSLGVANKIMEPMAGAVLAKILVLVFIILFIQKRPKGLFPQKGRSAED